MDNKDEKVTAEYVKGFNEGYLLAQFEPDLVERFMSIENTAERITGLREGAKQYFLEVIHEMSKDTQIRRDFGNDHQIDKDFHIEP